MYSTYIRVVLPGLVACDPSSEGAAMRGHHPRRAVPRLLRRRGGCDPCAANDQAALIEYLNPNYADMSEEEQLAELALAKDKWRLKNYGAGSTLSCCEENDADCPSRACEGLGNVWCHYCNDVGHFMLNKVKLLIGGQTVDQLYGTFLYCWEELTGASGVGSPSSRDVGTRAAQLVCDSRAQQELFVPLPFWYTQSPGVALPLAALTLPRVQPAHRVCRLQAAHRRLAEQRRRQERRDRERNPFERSQGRDGGHVCVFGHGGEEQFTTKNFEQLICQTQSLTHVDSRQTCKMNLSFNHPTKELIFCVRRQCQTNCNNWGNFSGIDGRDAIKSAALYLNTAQRFAPKSALYYRAVQPLQHHTNIPEAFIYVMSFALNPKRTSRVRYNLSRIDHTSLVLEMQDGMASESYGARLQPLVQPDALS